MVATRPKKTPVATAVPKKPVANSAGRKKKKATPKKAKPANKPATKRTTKAKVAKKETEDKQYDVEQVRGIMVKGNTTSYFIKWTGYSEKENSWEPSSMVSCAELVRKFLQKSLDNVPSDAASEDESA